MTPPDNPTKEIRFFPPSLKTKSLGLNAQNFFFKVCYIDLKVIKKSKKKIWIQNLLIDIGFEYSEKKIKFRFELSERNFQNDSSEWLFTENGWRWGEE